MQSNNQSIWYTDIFYRKLIFSDDIKSGYKVLSIPIKTFIIVKINHFILVLKNAEIFCKDMWLNYYTSIKNFNKYVSVIVTDRPC